MKRFFSIVLCLLILLPILPVHAEATLTFEKGDGFAVLTACSKTASGTVTVPQAWSGLPVYVIGTSAFEGCNRLERIVLPEGIRQIEQYAFSECENLHSINLPQTLTFIGNGAFACCHKLSRISLPASLKTLGTYAFAECTALRCIYLPGGLTDFWDSTFMCCEALENVYLENGITLLPAYTFSGCTALKNMDLPLSLAKINDYALPDSDALCIHYAGTETSFKAITISNGNQRLTDGAVLYNSPPKGERTPLGDVNANETLDAGDLTALARILSRVACADDPFGAQKTDYDGSGIVDSADLTALAKTVSKQGNP